jgi:hypothetical protein
VRLPPTPCRVCFLGLVSLISSLTPGKKVGARLTPSVARRARLDVYTYSDARSGDTPQFQPSEDRIGYVSGSTGRVLPARCSLYILHSLE